MVGRGQVRRLGGLTGWFCTIRAGLVVGEGEVRRIGSSFPSAARPAILRVLAGLRMWNRVGVALRPQLGRPVGAAPDGSPAGPGKTVLVAPGAMFAGPAPRADHAAGNDAATGDHGLGGRPERLPLTSDDRHVAGTTVRTSLPGPHRRLNALWARGDTPSLIVDHRRFPLKPSGQ